MSYSMKVDLGFVFALSMEAAGLVDLLEDCVTTKGNGRVFHRGKLKETSIAIVESGIGQEKAASATCALLDIFYPEFIISAGYAGGLVPELKRFDILQPELLLRKSDGITIDIANNTPRIIKKIIDNNNKTNSEQSETTQQNIVTKKQITLVTADQPIETTAQKLLLGEMSSAVLVDMETFAVAEACINWCNEKGANRIVQF
ncbi:MAG: hypothetical protein LBH59_07965, partial [Planctomycetaceae bacterium]|nr:hypothetical protein [Planctomycetaceae bacterium]